MGSRLSITVALCLVLLVCVMGLACAQDVTPQVTLNFDPVTFTYTYHVVVPQGNTYPFGQLLIFARASSWNGHEETWTVEAPTSGGQQLPWQHGCNTGDVFDTIEWRAMSAEQEILSGTWEGDFIVVAPDTTPVAGQGMTKDGVPSAYYFDIDVPGVPEPSSLFALASMAGMAGFLFRKRR
jgi:hypothetical protein